MSEYGFCHCGCGQRTSLATKTDRTRNTTKGEPRRFIQNHHARVTNRPRRQLAPTDYRVEDRGHTTPCWIWLGSTRYRGYGVVGMGGRYVAAYRAYYEKFVGPIPDGLELDHLCCVPLCVNPSHLEPVTHAENMRRWAERDGIPTETVEAIRSAEGTVSGIARRYGVSRTHTRDIRSGKRRP